MIKLKLSEVFTSFQGEGPYTGRYALFVRFAGCNLACSFCDTAHKRDKVNLELSPVEIEKIIIDEKHRHAVITGGEALLRLSELREIKPVLDRQKVFVEVETNGTILIPEDLWDWHFNISPKVWTAETYKQFILPPKCVLKFPVNKANLKETIAFIEKHNLPDERIYLMPMGKDYQEYTTSARDIMQTVQERKWNFSTRLHIVHDFR